MDLILCFGFNLLLIGGFKVWVASQGSTLLGVAQALYIMGFHMF